MRAVDTLQQDDLIVVGGAGGFIGGALVRYFQEQGFTRIRAIDKKPLPMWYQHVPGVESLCLDLSQEENCERACEDAVEVYNLAADMGGMGFIERFRIECLRSILINTHMIEAAYRAGAQRFFFSSSACAYNTTLQEDPNVTALKESDAYPAMAERGYGWEKLMSEMFCEEYWHERGLKTFIARFHNVYGPFGTWDGGREKAPAAICRKVIEAKDQGTGSIDIWGTGQQTRSFMFIDDCTQGIDMIMHCENLIATPINLGSGELVSINQLVDLAEQIGQTQLQRVHLLDAPQGVAGRNSDNTMIKRILGWEPGTPLGDGLERDVPVDRAAVPGPKSGQANRQLIHRTREDKAMSSAAVLTDVIGDFPYRLALAGGWIDQPFVSAHNPDSDGSMVVVGLCPDRWYLERAGMATGTRKIALQRWGKLPQREPAELVRELYAAENEGRAEPSGSQDMIGLIYPGVNRLDFRIDYEGGIFPAHMESCQDEQVCRWLEQVLWIVPVAARPDGYNPLGEKRLEATWIQRLGRSGKDCFQAILTRDARRLGESMNLCMACWETLLPHTVRHPTITVDLPGLLHYYQARYAGAMYSGCGGGYLYVVAESPVPGGFQPRIRRSTPLPGGSTGG